MNARDLLEGKPVRSPIHPALVHLPIGLLPLSLLLDLASWIWPRPELLLPRVAFYALAAGIVTALLAAIFGFVDYASIRRDHEAKRPATTHMLLNLIAVGAFAISAWLRLETLDWARTPALPALISLVGVGLISVSGYIGGHLVYNDGVPVGRHRHHERLPKETIIVKGPVGSWQAVAERDQLEDGDTLRVDAAGTVMTIARSDRSFFAVQEFCTHRYGPLSEGAIASCQVECPWHRSRFDLRTGEVTDGPAKVGLRTFKIEERDGKLWIEIPPKHE
ncbi:MAG TPA: DUF2231 domain-containing protein [Candidatus Synoicihabitans sp.]|nr:DUF2231 domain-containing protein [Candidatus Synoicihabitans sp.]